MPGGVVSNLGEVLHPIFTCEVSKEQVKDGVLSFLCFFFSVNPVTRGCFFPQFFTPDYKGRCPRLHRPSVRHPGTTEAEQAFAL